MTRLGGAWLVVAVVGGLGAAGCNTGKRSATNAMIPTSAPVLVGSDPTDGQTLVARDQTVQARFSTELHPDSLALGARLLDAAGRDVVGRAFLARTRSRSTRWARCQVARASRSG